MCANRLFCMEFNAKKLLFKTFSHIIRIFGSVKPQTNLLFHLSTLSYLKLIASDVIARRPHAW